MESDGTLSNKKKFLEDLNDKLKAYQQEGWEERSRGIIDGGVWQFVFQRDKK